MVMLLLCAEAVKSTLLTSAPLALTVCDVGVVDSAVKLIFDWLASLTATLWLGGVKL
jgi:hypothetical protein